MARTALWALALACVSGLKAGATLQTPLPPGFLLNSTLLSRNNSNANDTSKGFDNWLVPPTSCANQCVHGWGSGAVTPCGERASDSPLTTLWLSPPGFWQ